MLNKLCLLLVLLCSVYLVSSTPSPCTSAANVLDFDDDENVLFLDLIKNEIKKHVGEATADKAKEEIDKLAKKVEANINNGLDKAKDLGNLIADDGTVKKAIEQLGDISEGVRKALEVLKSLSDELEKEKGEKQSSTCRDKPVCKYDCKKIMNCPVQNTIGYMDLTDRIKENDEEKTAYNWVCKNALFSSSSQKDNVLSKYFRKLVGLASKKTEKQFIQENPNADPTKFDEQYILWLIKKGIHPSEKVVFDILNLYKNGLKGFEQICKEQNPEWLTPNAISLKLAEFELKAATNAVFGTKAEQLSDSTSQAFRKVGEWKMQYLTGVFKSEDDTYANALFKGLSLNLRSYFVKMVTTGHQQDFCVCHDYQNFFTAMNKLSEATRKKSFGVSNLGFFNQYDGKLRAVCSDLCAPKPVEQPKPVAPKPEPKKEETKPAPKAPEPVKPAPKKEETKPAVQPKAPEPVNPVAPKKEETKPAVQPKPAPKGATTKPNPKPKPKPAPKGSTTKPKPKPKGASSKPKKGRKGTKGRKGFRKGRKGSRRGRKLRRWFKKIPNAQRIFDAKKTPGQLRPTRKDRRKVISD